MLSYGPPQLGQYIAHPDRAYVQPWLDQQQDLSGLGMPPLVGEPMPVRRSGPAPLPAMVWPVLGIVIVLWALGR